MILIAAVDKNWGIGFHGKLLVRIPADQQIFQRETMGKTIVMGRKTFESIQGGRPLPGRTSYVLSGDPDFQPRPSSMGKVVVFRTIEALQEAIAELDQEQVYLIGGGQLYEQLLPMCHRAEITWINFSYEADTWCPNLEKEEGWKLTGESDEQIYFDLEYYYRRYERVEEI